MFLKILFLPFLFPVFLFTTQIYFIEMIKNHQTTRETKARILFQSKWKKKKKLKFETFEMKSRKQFNCHVALFAFLRCHFTCYLIASLYISGTLRDCKGFISSEIFPFAFTTILFYFCHFEGGKNKKNFMQFTFAK
jgi:hypothetical protein